MLTVGNDAAMVERMLEEGSLGCPGCGGLNQAEAALAEGFQAGAGARLPHPGCALGAEELRALKTRPLVVWGKHDPFGDHDAARRLAAATAADLAFAGTGHLPWLDDPEHIAALIRHHLDKLPRAVDRT